MQLFSKRKRRKPLTNWFDYLTGAERRVTRELFKRMLLFYPKKGYCSNVPAFIIDFKRAMGYMEWTKKLNPKDKPKRVKI